MLDMIGSFTGGINTHLVGEKGVNFIYREFFLTPTFFCLSPLSSVQAYIFSIYTLCYQYNYMIQHKNVLIALSID